MTDVRMQPVAAFVAVAVSKGLPMARITEATGLTMADLIQTDRRLPDEALPRLWRCIAEALPNHAIGLDIAEMAPFEMFGPLLHVASYAETGRDALGSFVRYRRLLASDLHLALERGPTRTALVMSHPLDQDGPTPGPEASLGVACRFIREVLLRSDAVLGVELIFGPFGPAERYAQVFGAPVEFGAPVNRLWLDNAALDQPTRQGDAHRFEHLTRHLELLHTDLLADGAGDGLNPVRAAIAHNARRGEYGAEAVAARMGMSLRSLQRLVRAAGTRLKALIEEARERHARRLLGDPSLSTDEVAFLVGYSSESAFRRAFRRWTGMSPAEARRGGPGLGA